MKIPRIFTCRRVMIATLAIPVVPLLLWVGLICLAPTDWARSRMIRELETATGRKVSIGSIRLGPLGNLRVRDVQVAEIDNFEDPWMKIAEARLDLHLFQLVAGCCKTTNIDVEGLDLRVHRRSDGTLEFADLLKADNGESSDDFDAATSRPAITLTLKDAHLTVLDDPTETAIDVTNARGMAIWTGEQATIRTLRGQLNGGTIECAATYNRYASAPEFDAEFRAAGVSLNGGMRLLAMVVPIVGEASSMVDGKLDFELGLRGRGSDLVALKSDLKGHGALRINPIDLSQSKLLETLDEFRQVPGTSRVGSIESAFTIADAKVLTNDLTMKLAGLPIILGGWSDFDGNIDYLSLIHI